MARLSHRTQSKRSLVVSRCVRVLRGFCWKQIRQLIPVLEILFNFFLSHMMLFHIHVCKRLARNSFSVHKFMESLDKNGLEKKKKKSLVDCCNTNANWFYFCQRQFGLVRYNAQTECTAVNLTRFFSVSIIFNMHYFTNSWVPGSPSAVFKLNVHFTSFHFIDVAFH